ncbi:MAG: hypothetical protein CVV51_05865 [Spirochaetae bacterium HGW-Spirochaetae-7]|nr:MAG: hypothetical protein CVV51_05865 [Spirochaetae bacterium HGW-Spirochaetae-7]
MRYGRQEKPGVDFGLGRIPDVSRRYFIRKAVAGSAAVAAAAMAVPLARAAISAASGIASGTVPGQTTLPPALPPGAISAGLYLSRCTACGLCVSKCPSRVLRPSIMRLGASGFLSPYLDYDASYCQYECTACLDQCPSGALSPMPPADRKLVQMGTAALVRAKCIVITDKTPCGACAEHCPTGAVRMVAVAGGLPEPLFDESICIGCGACHHICPAEPVKAITVSGKAVQGIAAAPRKNLFSAEERPASGDADAAGMGPGEFPF